MRPSFIGTPQTMPITPLHIGPGVLIKSAAGGHLSLIVFALAQVTMDLEVLARFALGSTRLHGFTNTFLGATVVVFVTVPIGKPVGEYLLRWWNRNLSAGQEKWLTVEVDITWVAAWTGGILGVYLHFVLDAMMHWEARPWAPFSLDNPFAGALSIDQLNWLCLVCFGLGVAWLGARKALSLKAGP